MLTVLLSFRFSPSYLHFQTKLMRTKERTFDYDSLKALRRQICENHDVKLRELLQNHVFIGFYSLEFGLLQRGTRAYMMRTLDFVKEYFYQVHVLHSTFE